MKTLIDNLVSSDSNLAYSSLKELICQSEKSNEVYQFFDTFVLMLDDKNSYVRTRGLLLIAANAQWDLDNKINKIIDKFLLYTADEKPITSRQCILSLENIVKNKKELILPIKQRLLSPFYLKYAPNMQSLIKRDCDKILKIISSIE